jgi:beta-lactam-binding protein with PASTA domain
VFRANIRGTLIEAGRTGCAEPQLCRARYGDTVHAAEDTQITQEHEVPGAPPPGPPPPPGLFADVGPWLAVFGLVVLAGLAVWFFVLHQRGNHGKVVPAVVGQPQRQAVSTLTADGLNVQEIVGPSSRPRGIVAAQKPGGGSRLATGQTVTLHVSNGHALTAAPRLTATTAATTTTAGTTTTAAAQVTVPSVTGQDMASAAGQIEAAGFVAETDPVQGSGAAGTVTAQDPPASAQTAAGGVVRLSVATGSDRPPVTVPDVVGQKAAAARATLLDANVTTKTVYQKGPAKSIGVVLAESPTGSQPRYTQVTLTAGS